MAVIKTGIHGGFRGKVAKVVGYQLNGQDVMRGQPRKRTTPPTARELPNRARSKVPQDWSGPITDLLRIGFRDHRPTHQGSVAAKPYNSKHALKTGDGITLYIDPSLALVSFGTLEQADTASVDVSVANQITINWDKRGSYSYNDHAMVLAYGIENRKVEFNTAIAKRQMGTATLAISRYTNRNFHVYLAFVTDDRKNRSNSQYLGEVVVELIGSR